MSHGSQVGETSDVGGENQTNKSISTSFEGCLIL